MQRFIWGRAWDVSHIVSVKVSEVREVTSVCKERAKPSHQLCLRPNSIKGLSIRLLNPTSPSAVKRASLPHPSTATDRMLQQTLTELFKWIPRYGSRVLRSRHRIPSEAIPLHTRVGALIVATIYLQLIQNRYMFRSFTVLQCSHQHCVQPVASDVEVVGYL